MTLAFNLQYKIRSLLPEKAKRVLRAQKLAFFDNPQKSMVVPQPLLEDCKVLTSRDHMLTLLPKNGIVCEVGVLKGDYSRKIIANCAPQEFHLVDINFEGLADDVRGHESAKMHQGLSFDVLKTFPDNYFDWIYIDADHTYEGVKADIEIAKTKVKTGGFLVFNDFGLIARLGLGTFGVHRAVCEFSATQNWPFAYFCFNTQGLYDVALRRP